mmetsp:Transcript_13976/g.15704  ORF Transcript_13976/g.15704 Transcript_13976/m.15704 type:complete len:334 (-) Transcript_13976:31-1032(-)
MPASFRRLRLPSSLILCRNNKRILYHTHDSRLFIDSYNRRETMLRLVSSSVSSSSGGGGKTRLLSTFFNPSFMDHRQKRRSDTNITTISSSHSHLSPTSIASSISVSSETLTSTLRAHFHSTPLSWFAAENIEEQKKEDATTTTIPTSSNDDGGDGDGDGDDSANVVVDGNDDDNGEPSATDIVYDFTPPAPLSQASQDKVQEILDKVLYLDMIEVHLLTQIVNEQMGISWKETEQRMSGRGGGGVGKYSSGGATDEAPVEEKTIFDLKLLSFDAKAKIKVIKEVRNIAGLGLKEAKEMVEGAPKVVQKELKKEKAEELKTRLEAVGAQMELV